MFCGCINALHLFFYIPQGSGADNTEADIVVPVVGVVVVPIRRTQVLRIVVPTPAAFHAVVTGSRSPFSHSRFLKLFVLASAIAAKTLLTRSAAFSSVIIP